MKHVQGFEFMLSHILFFARQEMTRNDKKLSWISQDILSTNVDLKCAQKKFTNNFKSLFSTLYIDSYASNTYMSNM